MLRYVFIKARKKLFSVISVFYQIKKHYEHLPSVVIPHWMPVVVVGDGPSILVFPGLHVKKVTLYSQS